MAKTNNKTKESITKFDYKTIKSFEDACKKEKVDPTKLPYVSMIPEEFREAIINVYKLFIIFKAINNGWIADFSNWNQYKYYPWFEIQKVSGSGFVFSNSLYFFTYTHSDVGVRLCTDSSEKALYIAKRFEAEYKEFLLNSK